MGAQLKFTAGNITNLSNGVFDLALLGSLTNIGPLDARSASLRQSSSPGRAQYRNHFPSPGCAAANSGVPNYAPKATLQITDSNQYGRSPFYC